MSKIVMNEGRILRSKLKFYGYEKGRTAMEFSSSMNSVAIGVMNVPEIKNFNGFESCLEDVIRMSKKTLDKYFNLHDILYLPNDRVLTLFRSFCDEIGVTISETRLDEFLTKIKEGADLVSPFDVPITLVNGAHSMVGQIKKNALIVPNDSFLESCPITFCELKLGDEMTLASAVTYSHEIVHSQLESIKGSCKNYHNREVLSIFVEKLVALDLDPSGKLLKKCEEARSRHLFENLCMLKNPSSFSRTDLVEASVYVTSIVQADHLFDKYVNGDIDCQTRILTGMQKVFDGECTVEDVLNENDVSLQNSMNSMLVKRRS